MFSIGVVGAGQFARHFMPLFQAHPLISRVVVTDLMAERRVEFASTFGVDTVESFEDMLASDIDAVAIFTQRHLHGPQAIAALEAGKHVYSAVPMALDIADIERIIDLVRTTRLTYYMGETCYYFPAAIYCREQYRAGTFGEFVYAQSQYYHDMDHGFYEAYQYSGGESWRRVAGIPPMYYPTHTVGPVVAATDSYVTKVSCMGYVDKRDDGVFGVGNNDWDNPFSNQVAIQQLANGGIHRVLEFRRVGIRKPGTHIGLFLGTTGSYEFAYSHHVLQQDAGGGRMEATLLDEMLNAPELERVRDRPEFVDVVANARLEPQYMSPVMPTHRLPAEFDGIAAGHRGSHKFLVDDFAKAVVSGKLAPVHAWASARYTIPGLVSHESAVRGGVALDVPDFGEPPSDWEVLELDA